MTFIVHRTVWWASKGDFGREDKGIRVSFSNYFLKTTMVLFFFLGSVGAQSDSADVKTDDIDLDSVTELNLEELMNIKVEVVSGEELSVTKTPAAVHVITAEDIRRGGFTTIPDALRTVPGLGIAQISASSYSVAARGFPGRFVNNLLVLVDGRAIYTSLFAGTLWEIQQIPMEMIERIEVIRGPGATLWGANAVNGVINILTKRAAVTLGTLVSVRSGNNEQHRVYGRYGHKLGDKGFMRWFGQSLERNAFDFQSGGGAHDDFYDRRVGMSGTYAMSERAEARFMLNAFRQRRGRSFINALPAFPFAFPDRDLSVAEGWDANLAVEIFDDVGERQWCIQTFYDRFREDTDRFGQVRLETFDLEIKRFFRVGEKHRVAMGIGYRHRKDTTGLDGDVLFVPQRRDFDKYNAFIQDTIQISTAVQAIVGAKIERNEFTGFEFQPSARIVWQTSPKETLWASVSRAIRTPARLEEDVVATAGVPAIATVSVLGQNNDADELYAYEIGWRRALTSTVTVDATAFVNDYQTFIAPRLISPTVSVFDDGFRGQTYGLELSASARPREDLRLESSYSFFRSNVTTGLDDSFPRHQFQVRAYYDLSKELELNGGLYFVDRLSDLGIPSYFRLDLGVTYRPLENLELSLVGQNLLENTHREFFDSQQLGRAVEIERAIYAQMTVRF